MPDLWSDLLDCLDLRTPASHAPDAESSTLLFEGRNQQLNYHRLFGGQLLGQFVRAAELACPDKSVQCLHALFAKEGRDTEPVSYQVQRHHQGRSFAVLTVVAEQSHGVIATASVSMHAAEDGRELQTVAPVGPVLPEEHRITVELLPWETRSAVDLDTTGQVAPEFELWMRTPTIKPEIAPAITAYATDLTLIGTALLPIADVSQRGNGTVFTSAVTAHSLWFHRPIRTDDWLLLRQHSPIVAGGRCFGRGDLLTEGGDLVASFAQEALLRFKS